MDTFAKITADTKLYYTVLVLHADETIERISKRKKQAESTPEWITTMLREGWYEQSPMLGFIKWLKANKTDTFANARHILDELL